MSRGRASRHASADHPAVGERDLDPDALLRWREDANLTGAANVEPNFTADELMEEFFDRVEVLNRITQAIRDASWPNEPKG